MLWKTGGVFDSEKLNREIETLEAQTQEEHFWDDRQEAERTFGALNEKKKFLQAWQELKESTEDMLVLYELLKEADEEEQKTTRAQLLLDYQQTHNAFEALKTQSLLSGPHDAGNAFLTIHTGAGGTESCDWVQMLTRLYMRWCEDKGFKTSTLDMQYAEGGIKSAVIEVRGSYAYGYLHAETGIHRLVRISPFDSSGRRHTTFASVHASPVIEDALEVEINAEEIRIDTYRASGAGGQHVNKTDSAVRITHMPTGIVVQCQNERSQHKNKSTALKILKSRLHEQQQQEKQAEREKSMHQKKDIAWGNQIRSYVFHPYCLVKDHRTNTETGNVQAVMNGEIDAFISAYLQEQAYA